MESTSIGIFLAGIARRLPVARSCGHAGRTGQVAISLYPFHNLDLFFCQPRKARRLVYLAVCGLYLALEGGPFLIILATLALENVAFASAVLPSNFRARPLLFQADGYYSRELGFSSSIALFDPKSIEEMENVDIDIALEDRGDSK